MSENSNIYLFEFSQEAMELVDSGKAIISSGGIRRKGDRKGFQELAKPITLSVEDFFSFFENKEHALENDERLNNLENNVLLSQRANSELKECIWLNHILMEQAFILSYNGFKRTLESVEKVASQVYELDDYIRRRDKKDELEKVQKYINYMKGDAKKLELGQLDIINSNVEEHLGDIAAYIKRLLFEVENETEEAFENLQILFSLISPFSNVVRLYSALFYYETNGSMPGGYSEWLELLNRISVSKFLRAKLSYYINLETQLPYKDKVIAINEVMRKTTLMKENIENEEYYLTHHTKEEYLTRKECICKKVKMNDYHMVDNDIVIFL